MSEQRDDGSWRSAGIIDTPLRAIFQALAAGDQPGPPEDFAERRRAANETMLLLRRPTDPDTTVTDHEIAVEGGTISVRVTRPRDPGPLPGYLFLHGGGWSQGTLDTADVECGPVAGAVPAVVISVDYRLAPEHPFPTPLDDCLAAYTWVLDHASDLGVDASHVGIGGASAGANLTAALCLAARERGLPLPCVQLLEVPALDLTLAAPSVDECGDGFGLTAQGVREFVGFYLGGSDSASDPLVSPLHASDLSGLPPAIIVVAELDPIRDDGERYARRLWEAGTPATVLRVGGHPHGTWIIPVTMTSSLVADLKIAALRRAFEGTLVASFAP